jgi:hypothetical protein
MQASCRLLPQDEITHAFLPDQLFVWLYTIPIDPAPSSAPAPAGTEDRAGVNGDSSHALKSLSVFVDAPRGVSSSSCLPDPGIEPPFFSHRDRGTTRRLPLSEPDWESIPLGSRPSLGAIFVAASDLSRCEMAPKGRLGRSDLSAARFCGRLNLAPGSLRWGSGDLVSQVGLLCECCSSPSRSTMNRRASCTCRVRCRRRATR